MAYHGFPPDPDKVARHPTELRMDLLNRDRSRRQEEFALIELGQLIRQYPKACAELFELFLEVELKFPEQRVLLQTLADDLVQTAGEVSVELPIPVLLKAKEVLETSHIYYRVVKQIDSKLQASAPHLYSNHRAAATYDPADKSAVIKHEIQTARAFRALIQFFQDRNYHFAFEKSAIVTGKCEHLMDLPPAFLELAACLEAEGQTLGALELLRGASTTMSLKVTPTHADYLSHMERLCLECMRDPRLIYQKEGTYVASLLGKVVGELEGIVRERPDLATSIQYLRNRHKSTDMGGRPTFLSPVIIETLESIKSTRVLD